MIMKNVRSIHAFSKYSTVNVEELGRDESTMTIYLNSSHPINEQKYTKVDW